MIYYAWVAIYGQKIQVCLKKDYYCYNPNELCFLGEYKAISKDQAISYFEQLNKK